MSRSTFSLHLLFLLIMTLGDIHSFSFRTYIPSSSRASFTALKMNVFSDAFRFFTNLDKEASAKHILITGPNAIERLNLIKREIESATDLSSSFSEIATKVSECPSAGRGGNLGTFKPGMMVKEFDQICFEKEVGKIHGPVQTQFGYHLILITRRYQGKKGEEERIDSTPPQPSPNVSAISNYSPSISSSNSRDPSAADPLTDRSSDNPFSTRQE